MNLPPLIAVHATAAIAHTFPPHPLPEPAMRPILPLLCALALSACATVPPEDMLALYRVTCEARQCPPLAVCADDIRAVRGRIAELDRRWQALAVGESLELEL